ncbi:hypothetical protein BKA70DRAFT_1442084 [Coprinopsis sp. MPI-PUGE-AT-0042]|nr:hypothetical protein BKA70DRAFT_1442084 [Coprinopsis sp. MPI-PUGE-AT-0042]
MSKLPLQLIVGARVGNGSKLQELTARLTVENYTLAVLEAGLTHLDFDDIPRSQSEKPPARLQLAIKAIQFVFCCSGRCYRTPELKDTTSAPSTKKFDGIFIAVALLRIGIIKDDISLLVNASSQELELTLDLWRYEAAIEQEILEYKSER